MVLRCDVPAPTESTERDASRRSEANAEPPVELTAGLRRLRLGEQRALAPDRCACCGLLAARALSVNDRAGRHLLVGYCDDCAVHVSRSVTRRWSALFAAGLLGASLAAGLPVAFPWLPWSSSALFAVAGSLIVPLLARALDRPRAGHAAVGHAVFFVGPGELIAARAEWAEDLGRRVGVTAEAASLPRRRWFSAPLAVATLAGVAAVWFHQFHHPRVRVLNLGEQTLEFSVDGYSMGRVQPSSAESPSAGLELRVPAGRRLLKVRDLDGNLVESASVRLSSGSAHLYAPASPQVCFWLEERGYGHEGGAERRTVLQSADPSTRFWTIPGHVRGWFSPNPPGGASVPATGGTSVVLRQGLCAELLKLQTIRLY